MSAWGEAEQNEAEQVVHWEMSEWHGRLTEAIGVEDLPLEVQSPTRLVYRRIDSFRRFLRYCCKRRVANRLLDGGVVRVAVPDRKESDGARIVWQAKLLLDEGLIVTALGRVH